MRVAHVVVDVPARGIDAPFDYLAERLPGLQVGSCVLVDFAGRPAVGYVVGGAEDSRHPRLKPVRALLGGPFFSPERAQVARWIAQEYVCPLSEALRLFLPPGGTPRAVKDAATGAWTLRRPETGPVDDRWVELTEEGRSHVPAARATTQRAVLDALSAGPVRAAELAADLGGVDGALRRLEAGGVLRIERRRRFRNTSGPARAAPRPESLTAGQESALAAVEAALSAGGGNVLLDGVTGSGKTEVYMRAVERVLDSGGGAMVLVPEISLTPQTVGRFRARFGGLVAVLHSALPAGERYDQWDLVHSGAARLVVGARSAVFAPVPDLRLIVMDEEHEASYKQGSAPRYHARQVARRLAESLGAALVLGSATPSIETLHAAVEERWIHVPMPERATGGGLPPVTVVDMGAEFTAGNRSMFSAELRGALEAVRDAGDKAVLLLNRRGFASFLLCRECGYVPGCEDCSTSLTYHEAGSRLLCHHCGASSAAPVACPACGSPYLRRFGAGTQRVEAELSSALPGLPVVRMDADTTRGKGGHERRLAEFEALRSGVLLGTQMIAKGLDYPEVTLVGVISADTALRLPDFRAAERTWQMLEQVAGRAGRGEAGGRVIVQTYWPGHPAISAAVRHDREALVASESALRRELGFPPFGRLVNALVSGESLEAVRSVAEDLASQLRSRIPPGWRVLGPAPAPLARIQRAHRWHVLLKAPPRAQVSLPVRSALEALRRTEGVTVCADVDPADTT
ncbi:MAG: primosomal protein N' [Coriobacteriia bacterium]|nr:primosomal protein N' [Coriobacteriia bacterium]